MVLPFLFATYIHITVASLATFWLIVSSEIPVKRMKGKGVFIVFDDCLMVGASGLFTFLPEFCWKSLLTYPVEKSCNDYIGWSV